MSTLETDPSLAARIGDRLRRLRKERRLTLAALSDQAGVSVSYLSAVEKGTNLPSLRVLARLTEALGVSIPAVVADEGSPHVQVGAIPDAPGVAHVAHPLLQLDNAVVRAAAGETGPCPVSLGERDVFTYVISGAFALVVDGASCELGKGDAADLAGPGAVTWTAREAGMLVWSSCPRGALGARRPSSP